MEAMRRKGRGGFGGLGLSDIPTEQTDWTEKELQRILDNTDLWDKKVCNLQITNASSQTIEIRALMSAATSPIAWDLRCLVREKLIVFLQENYPEALPRYRIELEKDDPQTDEGAG